ncbi:MAG: DMT family transporter [Gammaproteobacteria bacterium]
MRVITAFLCVIIVWSTTPLAIKWSGEGPGYLFGAASRMVIGLACMLPAMWVLRQKMPWSQSAWLTYLAVAMQIYGAMLAVYWASQYIPSGWISVIFGLTPMMTAILAAILLAEASLGPLKLLSYACGFTGLLVMFGSALDIGQSAVKGISAVVLSAFLQSASAVLIKRINAGIPAISQVTGGLLLAVPVYLITWLWQDGQWPTSLPPVSLISILYLGIIATTLGFVLYYYVLTHLPATRVALITLITPVMALLLGNSVNHEPLTEKVIFGSGLIMGALVLHQTGERRHKRRKLRT